MKGRFSVLAAGIAAMLALGAGPPAANAARAAGLDPTFGEGGRVAIPFARSESSRAAIAVALGDGGLILSRGRTIKRLTASGQLDESFGDHGTLTPPAPSGGEFVVEGLATDSQERLIVAGTSIRTSEESAPFTTAGVETVVPKEARVLRYLPSGDLDPGFGQQGMVETDLGLPPPYSSDGKPLTAKPEVGASGVAVDSQDRVILTGSSAVGVRFGCNHDWFFDVLVYAAFVARLTPSGALDAGFGAGDGVFGGHRVGENPLAAEASTNPIAMPGGNVIYQTGAVFCPYAERSPGLAALTSGGESDRSFGKRGSVGGYFSSVATAADGSVAALEPGNWPVWAPLPVRLVRAKPNGKPDPSFGKRGVAELTLPGRSLAYGAAVAIDPRGRVLIAGSVGKTPAKRARHGFPKPGKTSLTLTRLRADGRPDPSFGPHGRIATGFPSLTGVVSLLLDRQGRAVAAGRYRDRQGNEGLALARYVLGR